MHSLDKMARDVLDSLQEGCQVIGFDWRYIYFNDALVRQARMPREQMVGRTLMECYPELQQQPFFPVLQRSMDSRTLEFAEVEYLFPDGSPGWFDLRVVPVPDGICIISLDKTEERQARARLRGTEDQLRQSQKMEAVGVLAGGVAHDFNNLLSVILCCGELAIAKLPIGDSVRADLEEMTNAAVRAAALTRQLLMFSRQQVLEPRVLDLNELLLGMDSMLRRILGEDVELVTQTAAQLDRVRVDSSSIEQVIMNLVVNARDAMPQGGKLTLETSNLLLDEAYAKQHLGVTPGPHVMLAVTDTGCGIDQATQARVFEPFYTTKRMGKGTGLGLSTVFGIVNQSGGSVWLSSELGRGTTFKVFLPSATRAAEGLRRSDRPATLRGNETILLVEDDNQVRLVAGTILREHGYEVVEARNAGEALLFSERHPARIELMVTDVIMPQLSGPELAKRLSSARPDMKVLCMSGYAGDSIASQGALDASLSFLQKPFTVATLTAKVREVLDAPRG